MMNANPEQRDPPADAAGPKADDTKPARSRRSPAAKKAAPSKAPAATPKARRGRKASSEAAPAAKPAKPARGRRRAAVPDADAQLPLDTAPVAAPMVEPNPAPEAPVAADASPVVAADKAGTSRESFKLTDGDLAAIDRLRARAGTLGREARKSALVRAAIRVLYGLDDAGLLAALDAPSPSTGNGKRRKRDH